MKKAEHSPARQLTELWETTWSQVVEGPVDALHDVVARFEEAAPEILATAVQEGEELIVHEWHEQAQSQLMQYDSRQHISGAPDDQETRMTQCIQEAERQGLVYGKVAAYGTPGDPYTYAAYAHDHPEDPVAAQLLRCLAAVESGSQAGPEALEQRKQAIGELWGVLERVWSGGWEQPRWRPSEGQATVRWQGNQSCVIEGGLALPPYFDARRYGPGGCDLDEPLLLLSGAALQMLEEILPAMEAAAAAGRPLVVIAPAVSGPALEVLLLNLDRGALRSMVVETERLGERGSQLITVLPGLARQPVVGRLVPIGRVSATPTRVELRALVAEAAGRACSLCGSTAPVGNDGRCGPCRALVAASQAAGEATEQGWAVDPDTVVSWDDLAGHVPVLAGLLPAGQIDPALEEFLRLLVKSWEEVVRVVQAVVEGGEPPTPEMIQQMKVPFVQAFGPSGGLAYTGAAFGGFAAAHPGAWGPDPGQELRQGTRDAARDALGSVLPGGEGLASAIDDWLDRLGLKSEEQGGTRFDPEQARFQIFGGGQWYCKYCGKRLSGLGEICTSCAAAGRPLCRHCGARREAHIGPKRFCPAHPRAAR